MTDTSFYYDGGGNRLSATRVGVATHYVYDPWGNLMAEADGSNNITGKYIYGRGLLAAATSAGRYCYHFDGTGSTVAITDMNGNIVNSYAYEPFGVIVSQQETIPQPFKFVGRYGVMAEPDGLYYMRARYYDPSVGRFISEDPIGFGGGDVNLYDYVRNNPLNRIDPKGLAGIGFDVGGAYATGWGGNVDPNATILQGGSAGTGFYIGSKGVPGLVEIGAYTYQSVMTDSGRTPAAAIGAGATFIVYLTDAEQFFPGEMNITSYIIGPFSFTFSKDPCTDKLTGVSFSLAGKGLGWAIDMQSISYGYQGTLQ